MSTEPIHDPARRPISAIPGGIPLARPGVADPARVAADVEAILRSGMLTNGPYVRRFEDASAAYLGVRHCVAVSSCTSGLMLLLRAAELSGDVIVPSFTFAATAHAVDWNGLRPVFADVDRRTLTLSPASVERAIGVHTSAILATHIYGTPCDVEGLQALADESGVRLFFDAAHAFGSVHRRNEGRRVRRRRGLQPLPDEGGGGGRGRADRDERRPPGRAVPDRPRLREPGRLRLPVRGAERADVGAARGDGARLA